MCVRYSVSVIPPLPISSMSGSFQCPGAGVRRERALGESDALHGLPSIADVAGGAPQIAAYLRGPISTLRRPYWHRLNTIRRPDAASASPIAAYRACSSASEYSMRAPHQSYFR